MYLSTKCAHHRSILFLIVLFAIIQIGVAIDCNRVPANTEARLRKDLFCGYDPSVIPVKKWDTPVVIHIQMSLKAFNFNEDANTLDVSSWLSISWKDEFLNWQPAEYDDIKTFVESSILIWQPDLALYNSEVATIESQFCRSANCMIEHTGDVYCIPPCRHTAKCHSDYRRWPFDTQNCSLEMGTWVHGGSKVDFEMIESNIPPESTVSQNREWQLTVATYRYNAGRFSPNESYPTMEFLFQLERHSSTHAVVILTPAFAIVMINLVSLWLSPACIERLALVTFNVLCHFMYMQQLTFYVPSNGDVTPLVVRFYETSLWLTVTLMIVAIVTRGMNQSRKSVPDWMATTVAYVESVQVFQLCLRQGYMVDRQPLHGVSFDDGEVDVETNGTDSGGLSAVQINDPSPQSTKSSDKSVATAWRVVVRLIDRVLFIVLLLVYVLMMFEWLPEGYLTGDKSTGELKIHKEVNKS